MGRVNAAIACPSLTVGSRQPMSREQPRLPRKRGLTYELQYRYAAVAPTTLRKVHAFTLGQRSKYLHLRLVDAVLSKSVVLLSPGVDVDPSSRQSPARRRDGGGQLCGYQSFPSAAGIYSRQCLQLVKTCTASLVRSSSASSCHWT